MVGLKALLKSYTVRASSLIEVITALIIISIVLGMAIAIYLNVQRTGLHFKRLSYSVMMDALRLEVMNASTIGNIHHEYGDVVISVQSGAHDSAPSLLIIRFEVRDDSGRLLDEKRVLKYVPGKY